MTEQTPPTPPGWYPAPGDPPQTHRYWDGELWQGGPVAIPTAQTAPHRVNRSYTGWGTRVGAKLVDSLVFGVIFAVFYGLVLATSTISETLALVIGVATGIPLMLGTLYLLLWVPGITGQTPGRRVMGYEIVSLSDGHYIGGGAFIGREIVGGVINNFCYIDYLWPLFDEKNQRLADKVVNSVAVNVETAGIFPLFPSGKPF